MHESTIRMIKKQKQLLEMEINEYKSLVGKGKKGIHPHSYYVKLAKSWEYMNKIIKILQSTEDDIYNNFNYLEN